MILYCLYMVNKLMMHIGKFDSSKRRVLQKRKKFIIVMFTVLDSIEKNMRALNSPIIYEYHL